MRVDGDGDAITGRIETTLTGAGTMATDDLRQVLDQSPAARSPPSPPPDALPA